MALDLLPQLGLLIGREDPVELDDTVVPGAWGLLIAIALAIVWRTIGRPPIWSDPRRLVAYVSERAAELEWDRAKVGSELDRLRDLTGLSMSLYRFDGALVATNVEPPVAPLSLEQASRLGVDPRRTPKWPRWPHALPVLENGVARGYIVFKMSAGGLEPLTRAAGNVTAILAALALVSLPLARAMSRPIEQLTNAARSLGAGDLTVRSQIVRSDEIGELARAFDDMAERIERLVLSEKELLANVSHELRTPLSRVRVALELAREGDGDRARHYLEEIAKDVGEVEILVESVLNAARLDLRAGRAAPTALLLERTRFSVAVLLERASERFAALHPGRRLEKPTDVPACELLGDLRLLRRALANLLR